MLEFCQLLFSVATSFLGDGLSARISDYAAQYAAWSFWGSAAASVFWLIVALVMSAFVFFVALNTWDDDPLPAMALPIGPFVLFCISVAYAFEAAKVVVAPKVVFAEYVLSHLRSLIHGN